MTKYIETDGIGEVVSRSEYDALAAQVEALRDALDKIENWNECTLEFRVNYGSKGERDFYRNVAKNALAATPQQHLAEVRAQAVIDAVVSHEVKYGNSQFGRHLREYAANIRQEPK